MINWCSSEIYKSLNPHNLLSIGTHGASGDGNHLGFGDWKRKGLYVTQWKRRTPSIASSLFHDCGPALTGLQQDIFWIRCPRTSSRGNLNAWRSGRIWEVQLSSSQSWAVIRASGWEPLRRKKDGSLLCCGWCWNFLLGVPSLIWKWRGNKRYILPSLSI